MEIFPLLKNTLALVGLNSCLHNCKLRTGVSSLWVLGVGEQSYEMEFGAGSVFTGAEAENNNTPAFFHKQEGQITNCRTSVQILEPVTHLNKPLRRQFKKLKNKQNRKIWAKTVLKSSLYLQLFMNSSVVVPTSLGFALGCIPINRILMSIHFIFQLSSQ